MFFLYRPPWSSGISKPAAERAYIIIKHRGFFNAKIKKNQG